MLYLLALVAFLSVPLGVLAEEGKQPASLNSLPALMLRDLQGQEQSLTSLRGKLVVLNFWATWCAPCREEMPLLVSLQNRYEKRGVQVIGASVDDESTEAQIAPFVKKLKINFHIWLGATIEDMQSLGLGSALPATAILDRDGRVVCHIIGVVTRAELQERLEWLLSDRTTTAPPPLLNKIEQAHDHPDEPGHKHEGAEEHEHASVTIEGASSVPS